MTDSKAREAALNAVSDLINTNQPFGVDPFDIANAAIDAYIAARREEGFVEVPDLKELSARVDFGLLEVGIDHNSGIDGQCVLYSAGVLIASGIETDNAQFIAAVVNAYRAMLNAAEPPRTGEK